ITSSPKSTGMCSRVCSTATCWRRLISLGSETQRMEPAPFCLRTSSMGSLTFSLNSGPGWPGSCESWAIFSSRVICWRRAAALSWTWDSDNGFVGAGLVCADVIADQQIAITVTKYTELLTTLRTFKVNLWGVDFAGGEYIPVGEGALLG